MNFYVMTLFPEMVMDVLNTSILKRAIDKGIITAKAINIRDYADNKHNKVDDYTYGGGAGMLMQAQPIYDCYNAILEEIRLRRPDARPKVIYVTPQGSVFCQEKARELSEDEDIIFLCGHYEGIDERVLEEIVTDYISIGDYVLTGGELPAMVMIDAVARLVPGVLNNDESAQTESFDDGLLEYPQYSRPEVWREKKVPAVLLSGNHQNVDVWRFQKSLERTKERRPELYDRYVEEHPEQFTAKALKKRIKILDKIENAEDKN